MLMLLLAIFGLLFGGSFVFAIFVLLQGFLIGPMRWTLFFELVAIAVVSGAGLQALAIWQDKRRSRQRLPL